MKIKYIILTALVAVLITVLLIPTPKTAVNRMEERAKNGNVWSQVLVGQVYAEKGKYKKALKWFEKAAMQGDNDAYMWLSDWYTSKGNDLAYCTLQIATGRGLCDGGNQDLIEKAEKKAKSLKKKHSR